MDLREVECGGGGGDEVDRSRSEQGRVAGCCECGNELSVS
jgi:hypothetical protein